MFMFYFQYVQKRGEIMRSRISKTWPCHLKRAVLLSLLSGLFILPSQINAETSGEEYKDHQIAEADWDGAKAEQDFWSGKGIRNGSDYTFNKNTIISTELSKGSLVFHKTDYLWKQRNSDDERRQNSHGIHHPSVEDEQ